MPAPSKTACATSITENGGNSQLNSFGFDGLQEGTSRELHKMFGKEMDVPKEEAVALVCVDKDKLLLEKLEDRKEIEKRLAEVKKDSLSALIKDWSSSSRTFWRRDSCEFTTCVAPCVKKATSHLQQLQEQLMKWSLSREQPHEPFKGFASRNASSTDDVTESIPTPFTDTSTSVSERGVELSSMMYSPASEGRSFLSDTQEVSFSIPSPLQASRPKTTTHVDKSSIYRMGYSTVDEVLRLLGRLERDRLATEQMLVKETRRVGLLKSEIDRLAFKRLIELPDAVQKEHEYCTTDMNELKWHCSYQGRMEVRVKRRVDHAETQHLKFTEDVESSKRSCPLVEEKLELEGQAMASIQAKQDETDQELRETLTRLEATDTKTNEAKNRANQERWLIKQDVDVIRNLLNEVSDELAQLKMNYTSNVHTISDIKNTLKENAEQCHNLEKREERVKNQETAAQQKVVTLREKIVEQGSEHLRLIEENENLRKDNLITEGDYQTAIGKLKLEIKQHEIQVRELSRKNKTTREEMHSTSKHIEKCKKQKISDKKAIIRSGQEVDKIKQQNEMMSDEIKKVKTLNQSLNMSKAKQEEENCIESDTLRKAESSLKGQVKEEAHVRTVLQARIASDTSDLLRSRVESKKKKEKVTQQSADSKKVVTHINEQVSKLDKVHNERQQTISQLNEVLDKLTKQREEMESKYRARIAELRPKEELIKKEILVLEQKIDQITWKSDMMVKKMDDMSSSTGMMTRVVDSTQEDITELEEDNKEAKIQLEASVETDGSLKKVLEETKERCLVKEEDHRTHLEKREVVLDEKAVLLEEKLGENKTVAQKYQKLYSRSMQTKEDFFKNYESLVNEESHLKDHKEIHALQTRMRECLQHYYKLRGLHNKCQVAQFQLSSKENNDKLFELKQNLIQVITHINNFLESNNSAHKTISVEAARKTQTLVVS